MNGGERRGMMDEQSLIQQVQEGKFEAFGSLMDVHVRRLRAVIALNAPVPHLIDEIAHETYVFAYNHIHDFRRGTSFFAWLKSIAWNLLRAEMGVMVSIIRTDPETERQRGVVVRGERFDLIREAHIDAEYESNGLFHRSLRVHLQTHQNESFEIEGQVKSFIPLRNRKGRSTTHIGEGMTEWRTQGLVGQGLSEFLRQL